MFQFSTLPRDVTAKKQVDSTPLSNMKWMSSNSSGAWTSDSVLSREYTPPRTPNASTSIRSSALTYPPKNHNNRPHVSSRNDAMHYASPILNPWAVDPRSRSQSRGENPSQPHSRRALNFSNTPPRRGPSVQPSRKT